MTKSTHNSTDQEDSIFYRLDAGPAPKHEDTKIVTITVKIDTLIKAIKNLFRRLL